MLFSKQVSIYIYDYVFTTSLKKVFLTINCNLYCHYVFTARNKVGGKVIFSKVCVKNSGEVSGWYPSMHCRSPGPHPGGKLRGLAWMAGLQAHTHGGSPGLHPGVSQHALRQTPPPSRWLLLQVVHPTGMHSCFNFKKYKKNVLLSFISVSRLSSQCCNACIRFIDLKHLIFFNIV